jgi:hypothetical protein
MYCYFSFLETKGMSMAHMDQLFTVPWYNLGKHSLKTARDETYFDLNEDATTRASKISNRDVDVRHFEIVEKEV